MRGGKQDMVKGISKRVVIVHPEDDRFFEQAFFIVREGRETSVDALREACALAARYHARHPGRPLPLRRYTAPQLVLSAIGGGSMVGVIWWLSYFIF